MCGRMNIEHKSLCPIISEFFGVNFSTQSNSDLSPSQKVATITASTSGYQQLDTVWGLQPQWSKKLIINAQSETVAAKPTFKQAYQTQRCLVPCNGWYEWRTENNKKQKYLFSNQNDEPLLMAGIWYAEQTPKLITLTTTPNEKCAQYHKRMPLFILPESAQYWFQSSVVQLQPLLQAIESERIHVEKC